ncbi:hypothetical protein [Streptomyces qinzhouensis]|uniref:Lipoprotein n=1 Tax=Streptomyces qinzhouensis TaxID=2599401 RepID=A0A5B8IIN1_9ACTN|nr:hypothetical protein [Streptomyces qinzhouensis]QDY78272.1 hypothetical protein FQU76_19235 [Streptomyces qinzhouensis]
MRARTSMTAAAAAAALGAALVLTGCSSDDGKSSSDKAAGSGGSGDKAAASSPAKPGDGAEDSGGGTGGTTKAADVEGAWTAVTDAKPLSLAVTQGKAVLMAEGGTCSGELADHGSLMLSLKCADGSKKRTMGTVAVANDQLTVVWNGGAFDTFTKIPGTTLPKELKDLEKLKDLPQYTGQGS